jgi:single-strand DNA-binding protein
MSRSLNKVTLIGNVGNDPEVRSTNGGTKVATLSVATSNTWTNAAGEKQEKTEWHRCVIWNGKNGGLADVVEKYVKKGSKLYIEGQIEYRQWQDKDNQTRYTTEIKVKELLMLDSAKGSEGGERAPRAATAKPAMAAAGAPADSGADEDDDLPF